MTLHWVLFGYFTFAALRCVYVLGNVWKVWKPSMFLAREYCAKNGVEMESSPLIILAFIFLGDAVLISLIWPIGIPLLHHFVKKWAKEMAE